MALAALASFTRPSYCQFLLLLLFCGLLDCASYAPCPGICCSVLEAFLFAIDLWFGDSAPRAQDLLFTVGPDRLSHQGFVAVIKL